MTPPKTRAQRLAFARREIEQSIGALEFVLMKLDEEGDVEEAAHQCGTVDSLNGSAWSTLRSICTEDEELRAAIPRLRHAKKTPRTKVAP